jgi:hypothetical protein
MVALYQNFGTLPKCWRVIEMLAHIEMLETYENVGALLNCQRTMEMLLLYTMRHTV